LCKPFGEFDEDTPIGRVLDFSKCDDQPQTFDDVQIDVIIPNQPPQFVTRTIEMFCTHRNSSRSELNRW